MRFAEAYMWGDDNALGLEVEKHVSGLILCSAEMKCPTSPHIKFPSDVSVFIVGEAPQDAMLPPVRAVPCPELPRRSTAIARGVRARDAPRNLHGGGHHIPPVRRWDAARQNRTHII